MRSIRALLAFGMLMTAFGIFVLATPSYTSYYSRGTDYTGVIGVFMSLFGILICIVAGILIEREKMVKT